MSINENLRWENEVIAAIIKDPIGAEIQAIHSIDDMDLILYGELFPIIYSGTTQSTPDEDLLSFLDLSGKTPILDLKLVELVFDELKADPRAVLGCNISSDSLVQSAAWEKLLKLLIDNEAYTDRLVLELRETRPLGNAFGLKNKICDLRRMQIRVGVDDFGSGYITPLQILNLDVDLIKIDPLFIQQYPHEEKAIENLIQFAQCAAPFVVIKGIDTHEEELIVKNFKATHVQGSYLSQPVVLSSAAKLTKKAPTKFKSSDNER